MDENLGLSAFDFDNSLWDLSNEILYEMCAKYPRHTRENEIIAKVLLIGRVYAAAIERRKEKSESSDDFYAKVVAPAIKVSHIDSWLREIANFDRPTNLNCVRIIAVHKNTTDLFYEISGLDKRSLASKYLHFHFPNLFFIYDSRSAKAITKLQKKSSLDVKLEICDSIYADFYLRCMEFRDKVEVESGKKITPRMLDNYLLSH